MKASIASAFGFSLIASLLVFAAAKADDDNVYVSFAGDWRLNEAESHYPGGFRRLHDEIIHVQRDDGRVVQYVDSGVLPDGTPSAYGFHSAWNAGPGLASDGSLIAFRHLGPHEFVFRRIYPLDESPINRAGSRRVEYCRYSADGNRLTCEPETEPTRWGVFREVYDRIH